MEIEKDRDHGPNYPLRLVYSLTAMDQLRSSLDQGRGSSDGGNRVDAKSERV